MSVRAAVQDQGHFKCVLHFLLITHPTNTAPRTAAGSAIYEADPQRACFMSYSHQNADLDLDRTEQLFEKQSQRVVTYRVYRGVEGYTIHAHTSRSVQRPAG